MILFFYFYYLKKSRKIVKLNKDKEYEKIKEFLQDLKNEIDNLDAENRKKYKSPYTIDYICVSKIDLYAKIKLKECLLLK